MIAVKTTAHHNPRILRTGEWSCEAFSSCALSSLFVDGWGRAIFSAEGSEETVCATAMIENVYRMSWITRRNMVQAGG
jgi:hypothetical protein